MTEFIPKRMWNKKVTVVCRCVRTGPAVIFTRKPTSSVSVSSHLTGQEVILLTYNRSPTCRMWFPHRCVVHCRSDQFSFVALRYAGSLSNSSCFCVAQHASFILLFSRKLDWDGTSHYNCPWPIDWRSYIQGQGHNAHIANIHVQAVTFHW